MSHSFSTYHSISEQGMRHAHPRASAAAMSRHVQRSHKGYTLTHAGHQIRIGPVAFWIVVGALVVMGVWSIATGTYFAFRENVLTRLIGRQAEMQFAYEDRIAELRGQVDRVMSRQLLDQEQFEQKLKHAAAAADNPGATHQCPRRRDIDDRHDQAFARRAAWSGRKDTAAVADQRHGDLCRPTGS